MLETTNFLWTLITVLDIYVDDLLPQQKLTPSLWSNSQKLSEI